MNNKIQTGAENTFRIEIVDVDNPMQMDEVKELVWEYFSWGNAISIAKHGYEFDISKMLADFLNDRKNYKLPYGIMYLLRSGGVAIGVGGFKKIKEDTCELKRVYIKESYRKKGFGTKLLQKLIADAQDMGYLKMKLESAKFMEDAFRLYQRFGFKETPIYAGVESPEEYQSIIYCMELSLPKV